MFARKKVQMTKGSHEIDGRWLKDEFDRLDVSAAEVGKELGCDPKKIYNHLNGETKLQAGLLAALWIAYPQLDMHYVLTGKPSEVGLLPVQYIPKTGAIIRIQP